MSRVPGEIKRSRDLRGGRWSWTLKLAQKRSWVGRWSWAEQVGPLLLRVVQVVRQQQCNGHCLCLICHLASVDVKQQWRRIIDDLRFHNRSQWEQVYTADGSVAAATFLFSRASLRRFDDSPQEHTHDEIFYALSPNFSSVVFEDVPPVEFMYFVLTLMPATVTVGDSGLCCRTCVTYFQR